MSQSPAFVPIAGHEGRASITDYDGWKWCIATSGKRAVPFHGRPDANGLYSWRMAREAGLEVDIGRPITDYPDSPTGPQIREIHRFLSERFVGDASQASTATLPTAVSGHETAPRPGRTTRFTVVPPQMRSANSK